MLKKDCYALINDSISNSSPDQLQLLFDIYQALDCHCDFFMSEASHMQMRAQYCQLINKTNPLTFKTFICNTIPHYTLESKRPALLKAIQMIHNNDSFNQIINTLCRSNI